MRNTPWERYCSLIALINLLAFYGLTLWLLHNQTVIAALATIVAFNFATAWLLAAGIGRDAAGNRTWTARPAVIGIPLSGMIAVGLFFGPLSPAAHDNRSCAQIDGGPSRAN